MKRLRKIVVMTMCTFGAYFLVGALLFRLPIGHRVKLEGEVMWQLLSFGGGSVRHWLWEAWPWGTANLFLVDGRVLQISEQDDALVWSEPWSILEKDRRTKRVIVSTYPVLVGGYGPARVEAIVDVEGVPLVSK